MTTPPNAQAARKLTAARSKLIMGQPFFGMLALRLALVERSDIPTLAVDGKSVFYNPQFVLGLSDRLCQSAMAHEVMHCVLAHISRRGSREPLRWNYAIDFAANLVLKDSGFEIGDGWLLDNKYRDMTAEQIYPLLPEKLSAAGGGGPLDEIMEGTPGSAETDAVEWKVATLQAAATAKAQGKLPASLDRFVEDVTKPQVDWRAQLRQFVTQICKDDYAWSRPNRRYLSAGMYLPGLYSENMGPVVVGIDTSGSIDGPTLTAFGAEIRALAAAVKPSEIHVVYCDAEVNHVDVFTPYDDMQFKPHGGGGTDFRPVAAYVQEKNLSPECVVYLTDGYGPFPEQQNVPWLWCMTTDVVAPFGETIRIEV
ncbi:hypothetical protein DBR23_11770 [Acidovorax sp. HMWF018]|uniref:vWA domain-containing protein n=1 Tax=Acidovorax sp. HMWF018 TaxID=2056855 RepID=UPI000D3573E6|nr:VWA-like domain-containing protein [Acidovorax sp. HMWF018]PTT39225.1 hypothetical protein DBR23_11770 [Acidovorax sp. HMWF018]